MADNNTVGVKILTSNDIFIEINGTRVAGVQSYDTKYTNDVKLVDAFGQATSIGFTTGKKKYTVNLSRVYLEDTAIDDGIDMYNLSDYGFNLVVIKNGERIVYKDCIISDVSENGALNDKVTEKMSIIALNRVKE